MVAVVAIPVSVADSVADLVAVVAGFVVSPEVATFVVLVAAELALKQPVVSGCWGHDSSNSQSMFDPESVADCLSSVDLLSFLFLDTLMECSEYR